VDLNEYALLFYGGPTLNVWWRVGESVILPPVNLEVKASLSQDYVYMAFHYSSG
jgi:hypothetical protein